MANYYLDSEGKLTTKNDKKKKKSTNYYLDSKGRLVPMEDAPEEDSGIKLFKAGAFDDGYQRWDGVKSVGSTVVDLGAGAIKGILGMGEGLVDAAMYGVAGVSDLVGADSFADDVKRVAKKNTVDGWFAPLKDSAIERNSLLGSTGDSVAEAVGQIGAILLTGGVAAGAGASTAGVSAITAGTMFASSTGSGISEAYNSGATDEEAYTYGAMKGAIDAGSELIFGGLGKTVNALGLSRGISSLDDVFAKKLSSKLSNRAAQNLAEFGVKASAEGLEEVIAGLGSAAAKKLTYMSDTDLKQLVEDENLLEQFVVGTIASGLSQSADVTRSIKNDTDFITGMTANEETVVNKEAEKRIKEREDAGEKLTNKQKNEIHKQVESDLAKGYIDIDTIESTLGGETYSQYKSLTDQENALKEEIESLENLPKEQITVKQSERLKEAREQLEGLDTATVKERLGQEVSELAKVDRLSESYNEKARRSQAFEADLTKYSEKERAVVQKAAESGILNNTNKTHDFVDMVAKISAEKGVSFDFTNNQKLKESGFAVEGATVNGFVDGNDITLNIDSQKALNTVVGHEITHVLEGTELYGELQKAIKEYAEMKGEYKTRLEAISKVYNGRNADIEAEITADLVGDYLFTDSDFISKLSAEKPNIFKRIYEEIKYLVKLATAGSTEARQLEKVKRAFDKAYREGGKTTTDTEVDSDVQYSVSVTDKDTIDFLENQEHIVTYKAMQLIDGKLYPPMAAKVKDENGKYQLTNPSQLGVWQQATEDTKNIKKFKNGVGYYTLNKGDGSSVDAAYNPYEHSSNLVLNDQFESAHRRDNLVTVEGIIPASEMTSGYKAEHAKDSTGVMDWKSGVVAGKLKDNKRQVYLSRWFKPVRILSEAEVAAKYKEILDGQDVPVPFNVVSPALLSELEKAGVAIDYEGSPNYRYHQKKAAEKEAVKYSISDSEGRELAPAIQKRFANSKAVNENGELKVLYHGTPSGEFTIFDKSKGSVEGDFGSGFYFTDNEADVTEHYEGGGPDFENKVARRAEQIEQEEDIDYDEAVERAREELFVGGHKFEVYLNIENPAIVGKTTLLDQESLDPGYNPDDFDSEDEYYEQVEQSIAETIDEIVWEVERNVDVYSVDGLSEVLFEAYYEGGIGIEELKAKINDLYLEDENGNLVGNEVTRQIIESLGYDGIIDPTVSHKWNMDMEEGTTHYIVFKPNQIKAVTNENPTDNPDIHKSLSADGQQKEYGNYNVYGSDIALNQDVAPVAEPASEVAQDDIAPVVSGTDAGESENWRDAVWNIREPENGNWTDEYVAYYNSERAKAQRAALKEALDNVDSGLTPAELMQKSKEAYSEYERVQANSKGSYTAAEDMMLASLYGQYTFYDSAAKNPNWAEEMRSQFEQAPMTEDQANERDERQTERLYSLDENSDMPSEAEAPYTEESPVPESPFDKRDIKEVGNRSVKAYMYENPEVKPFFQEEAQNMLGELQSSIKGERWYNDNLHYQTSGDLGFFGTKRMTSPEIAYLLDNFKYTYAQIEKGLRDIIEDHGAENNAVSKRIEFLLDERLREGYTHFMYGDAIPPNQDYINLLAEKQITEYNDEAFNAWASTLKDSDVPVAEDIAPAQTEAESAPLYDAQPKKGVVEGQLSMVEETTQPATHLDRVLKRIDNRLEREKTELAEEFRKKKADMQKQLKDRDAFFSNKAAELFEEISNLKKGVRASAQLGYLLDYGYEWRSIKTALQNIKYHPSSPVNEDFAPESVAREMLEKEYEDSLYALDEFDSEHQKQIKNLEANAEKERANARKAEQAITRKELHASIVDKIKRVFAERGFDFDEVLKKAKNLSTFRTVDNTPQRVMEKALGYKQGQALSDLTVNQVAQNETEGIKWLSSFTDRRRGLLAQISKQYGIKPGSKESAAAQMYAEGFYVAENNDIIAYGDAELAKDFPNQKVQENIKALARDGRIRQIYDETLRMINESRTRNAYPEIPRLDNYFLHFRAMDDTFSRLGLPFNPNDIRAKDLPTDLNGVTADLKPGQPYFASAMHRTGQRTSFDLLGGLERYLTSAKNQIYHIDDIQTLRALRNYIADAYGQAKGLEGLDTLSEEEAQERISQVYGSHLSTFAKFLNEEANTLAGKTSLIDRGLEGVIGRRGITFLNEINKQVGSNMVGFNLSSSLTNFISVVQAFAKSNKASFVKAFAQTTANKLGSLVGKGDGFADQSPVMIRRKGADRFYRTPWQKAGDAGYFLMSAVDGISTELIARTKYNELVSKGMDAQKAHYETDKWVSRLMGDRSLGQQPQLYDSKMLGLFTKFQLEVRNQLDSQFYDTIQEAKVSNEEIENRLARNARTAAKVTSTFFQLAVAQHLFGKAFESIAGYNPAFDILGALIKAFGFDDDEESEDTVLDNVEQGFMELLEDMPYASTFTGGRIPIESALPIKQLFTGKDDYGNEKSRLETLAEAAPYYLLPSGFGQIKKTYQGSQMFDDDLPVAGSYTDSGNLRFSVEDTAENRLQAGLFGQWASDEARDYFDNERSPLKEKQIQELVDLDLPIREYWDYRKGLSEQETLEDKFEYINSQPVSTEQKNIMINNVVDRKEPVDMSSYDDFADYEEFDFYTKNTEKYNFLQENGVSYSEYKSSEEAKEEYDNAYSWVKNNPDKVTVAKAVTDNVIEYRRYTSALNDIRADKDASGKTINGSAKEKKIAYIDSLNIDYGAKLILFKSEYKSDDTYNYELLEYLNSRDDITWGETVSILTELGFTVRRDGTVEW